MKVPVTAAIAALTVMAGVAQAQVTDVSAACTEANLNISKKVAASSFYSQSHNQDLVEAMSELRTGAQQDMTSGDLISCGQKAVTLQAMVTNQAQARVTLTDFQSRLAAQTGTAVENTMSVPQGPRITQQQIMGKPLMSLNGDTLGVITGITYSASGQPLYLSATPSKEMQQQTTTGNLTIPVGLLLVRSNKQDFYVGLSSREFWADPRFRDNSPAIEPAG